MLFHASGRVSGTRPLAPIPMNFAACAALKGKTNE
jgi:hypothetical protein